MNHDLDDALRAGVLRTYDIPGKILKTLGNSHAKRIDTMVRDLVYESLKTDLAELRMTEKILSSIYALRDFLFESVYESDKIMEEFRKAKKILKDLYTYYLDHAGEVCMDIPKDEKPDTHQLVCDFIAGMTDRFALRIYEKLFLPQQWTVL